MLLADLPPVVVVVAAAEQTIFDLLSFVLVVAAVVVTARLPIVVDVVVVVMVRCSPAKQTTTTAIAEFDRSDFLFVVVALPEATAIVVAMIMPAISPLRLLSLIVLVEVMMLILQSRHMLVVVPYSGACAAAPVSWRLLPRKVTLLPLEQLTIPEDLKKKKEERMTTMTRAG